MARVSYYSLFSFVSY